MLLPPTKFSPAKQVRATAPLGFYDPAGFTKEGDEAGSRNLHATEVQDRPFTGKTITLHIGVPDTGDNEKAMIRHYLLR